MMLDVLNNTNSIKDFRSLAKKGRFGEASVILLGFVKAIEGINDDELKKLRSFLIRDELSSNSYNLFRLMMIHYLDRSIQSDVEPNILKRFENIHQGSGYLSKGQVVPLSEVGNLYDVLIPFSFLKDSKPNFDSSRFVQDISGSQSGLNKLFRDILSDRTETKGSVEWYQNIARAVYEIFQNIIRHPFNQMLGDHVQNVANLRRSEFWSVHIRRFSSIDQASSFSSIPSFPAYIEALTESDIQFSRRCLAVSISNDGPSINEYFNHFHRGPNRTLKDVVEQHLSTAPDEGAGLGCDNAIRCVTENGGFVAFCSGREGYAAFPNHWRTTSKANSKGRHVFELPKEIEGTSVQMLIPYVVQ